MEIKTVEELKDAIDTCDQAIDGLERAIDIFVSPNFFSRTYRLLPDFTQ